MMVLRNFIDYKNVKLGESHVEQILFSIETGLVNPDEQSIIRY